MRAVGLAALVFVAIACAPDDTETGRSFGPKRGGTTTTPDEVDASKDGGTTPIPNGQVSCTNGLTDGDETDVDCGGETCPPCANGRVCVAARDCVSNVCADLQCSNDSGCSDGTREGFASIAEFPNIAACAGAWALPGLGTASACNRKAGNSSANPIGNDCHAADLCQVGWHLCESAAAVLEKSGGLGCAAGGFMAGQNMFFATRQSGTGGALCNGGTNDLFGCGDVGLAPDAPSCGTLDRFSNDLCQALPATWNCGNVGTEELNNVKKTSSDNGGVLCCRD